MRYLNVILTIIAVLLAVIGFRLFELSASFTSQGRAAEQVIASQQAVISSNQQLELSLSGLRKQIADIGSQLPGK
ncbi:MAG: hypothetical protein WCY10_03360 [Candidatus Omnitrophota bacterium]